MDLLPVVIAFALGAVLAGSLLGFLAARQQAGLRVALAESEERARGLAAQLHRADAVLDQERVQARQAITAANGQQQGESRVLTALAPVRQQLEHMQRAVASMEEQRLQQHGELAEQLRMQQLAGERLRSAAESLGAAMQQNQARGSWGEAQLQNILRAAGMLEHLDYDVQPTAQGEYGRVRPDVVLRLPGDGRLIIDAKAPLTKYLAAQQLRSESGDAQERARRRELLHEHSAAVRRHVQQLAGRDYPAAITGSAELVIAFLPSEAALAAALETDPALLEDAFAAGIALASPVSLWATLRAVAYGWRQQRLELGAQELVDLARQLQSRLATAAGHLDKLGRSLGAGVSGYNALLGSLESRVLPTARRMAELSGTEAPTLPPSLLQTPRPANGRIAQARTAEDRTAEEQC